MKKQTLLFILFLLVFFFWLDFLLHNDKKDEGFQNTGTVIVSNPVVPSGILNDGYEVKTDTGVKARINNHTENDNEGHDKQYDFLQYYSYAGDWGFGKGAETVSDIKDNGGIIFSLGSLDDNTSKIKGTIEIILDPLTGTSVVIKVENELKNGAVYFEYDDERLNISGNGVIVLDNNTVKIRISSNVSKEYPNIEYLNGLYIMKKVD